MKDEPGRRCVTGSRAAGGLNPAVCLRLLGVSEPFVWLEWILV